MHFRSEVRNFALTVEDEASQDHHTSKVPQRKRPQPDRLPLLKSCDALRNDLMPLGVQIKVKVDLISLERKHNGNAKCFDI